MAPAESIINVTGMCSSCDRYLTVDTIIRIITKNLLVGHMLCVIVIDGTRGALKNRHVFFKLTPEIAITSYV